MVNKCRKNLCTKKVRDILELDFCPTPDILREEYLDIYEENTVRNIKHYKI